MAIRKAEVGGIGLLAVLTVLLVLILTTFSVLTLTAARADRALARRNADTVTAYYAADAKAAALYEEFADTAEPERIQKIPISQYQDLVVHLARQDDGSVRILQWQTVEPQEEDTETVLPVWDGTTERR